MILHEYDIFNATSKSVICSQVCQLSIQRSFVFKHLQLAQFITINIATYIHVIVRSLFKHALGTSKHFDLLIR